MSTQWNFQASRGSPKFRRVAFLLWRRHLSRGLFSLLLLVLSFWTFLSVSRRHYVPPPPEEHEHKTPLQTVEERLVHDRFFDTIKQQIPWNINIPDFDYTRTLVIAAQEKSEVAWIPYQLPDVDTKVYIIDNESAPLHAPKNKGREAMSYLTYIIDHYDRLPDVVLFWHPDRFTWHNNLLLNLDSAQMIRRLSSDRVIREGYMNARCHPEPGCPDWLHLDRPEAEIDDVNKPEERHFREKVWHELFGHYKRLPKALSQPCCAQFAVSSDAILRHPLKQYVKWREWLLNTHLSDDMAGRVFEYSWQYIFTGQAEVCPSMNACYCDGYGVCFGSDDRIDAWMRSRDVQGDLERKLIEIEEGREEGDFFTQLRIKKESMDMQAFLDEERIRAFYDGQGLGHRKLAI